MTGVYPTTFGDIYIEGDSITEVCHEIQERTGICNQFDFFWPRFTPSQMFNVIGSFKGMSGIVMGMVSPVGYPQEDIESECKRLMETFHMTAYTHRDSRISTDGEERGMLSSSRYILWRYEAKALGRAGLYEGCGLHHSG